MKTLYETKAISQGGRDGLVKIDNSNIEFNLAVPAQMGGEKKDGVNPEQLFAAGYSACFDNAILHVARRRNVEVKEISVEAKVTMSMNSSGGFVLGVDLVALFSELSQEVADKLVEEAHCVCPYSNATRGNIDISVKAVVK